MSDLFTHQPCDLDLWALLEPHLEILQRRARSGMNYFVFGSKLRPWRDGRPAASGCYGVVVLYSLHPQFIYGIARDVPLGQTVAPEQLLCYRLVRKGS